MARMTAAEFIDRYYKPDRANSTPDMRDALIASRIEDIAAEGFSTISRFDSVTGTVVAIAIEGAELPSWLDRSCVVAIAS